MAPDKPAIIDGATATLDELKAAISAAKQFMAKANSYQACLTDEALTKIGENPNPLRIFSGTKAGRDQALIDSSKKMKEDVGASMNTAIAAFNKAHPAQ